MDNILTSLAFSIYSNKGVYALLLGSGISAPSGIPTGWSVLMDLIRKIAVMDGSPKIDDPEKWYIDKYGSNPDYSDILSKLVKTQTERVNLLRPYFEPTPEEKENGLKEPTKAHRAIAKMAKNGYLKVILTTNFDRLLEKAFEDEGIIPHVIYHEDDIDGAIPLVHAQCTIVKINGDYIDCRFKNTTEELSLYSDKLNNYLTKIFEDFGIITCGWSGVWDKALISQIRASSSRRYAGYYTYKGNCEIPFKELCKFRNGELLEIKNADAFFSELSERINALESFNSVQHPLNKDIAIARIKKYLVNPQSKILLYDMVQNEVRRAKELIDTNREFNLRLTSDVWDAYWSFHMHNIDTLIPICQTIVQWGGEDDEKLITDILKVIAGPPNASSWNDDGKHIHYLPTLVLLYVIGITAVRFQKFHLLNEVFHIKVDNHNSDYSEQTSILQVANPSMFDKDELNRAIHQNYRTPLSAYLFKALTVFIPPSATGGKGRDHP